MIKASKWHNRLDYPSMSVIERLMPSQLISCTKTDISHDYFACGMAKYHKLSFMSSHTLYIILFELMYVDLWCCLVIDNSIAHYFMLVVYDYSRSM